MQLDGLWTVHILLALSSFTLGDPALNEPLAAPRVFISFKGRKWNLLLHSFCFSTLLFSTHKLSLLIELADDTTVVW